MPKRLILERVNAVAVIQNMFPDVKITRSYKSGKSKTWDPCIIVKLDKLPLPLKSYYTLTVASENNMLSTHPHSPQHVAKMRKLMEQIPNCTVLHLYSHFRPDGAPAFELFFSTLKHKGAK